MDIEIKYPESTKTGAEFMESLSVTSRELMGRQQYLTPEILKKTIP
jgi:hypothetical protein